MRPVSVFANGPASEIEQLQAGLRGRWRQAARAVMVLLSLHGLAPAQMAELLDCHRPTVRRWISRSASQRRSPQVTKSGSDFLTSRHAEPGEGSVSQRFSYCFTVQTIEAWAEMRCPHVTMGCQMTLTRTLIR